MDVVTHAISGALVGAAFSVPFPEHAGALITLGTLAGMLPDLDFLAELKGKEAAWKLHRILLHGIVPSFALGAVLWGVAACVIPLGLAWLAAVVFSALTLHLFLDVLTSFGTCLFYPFSKHRVSLKSHFIVDPIVLGVCVYSLIAGSPVGGIVTLLGYIVVSWGIKWLACRYVSACVPPHLTAATLVLEPALLAPFRWLAILKTADGYVFASLNFFVLGPWHEVSKGDAELLPVARANGLLSAVLDTFEFPVLRRVELDGQGAFVLEDVKWWTERPFRPLAFSGRIVHGAQTRFVDVVQGGFFMREHHQHSFLVPPRRLPESV